MKIVDLLNPCPTRHGHRSSKSPTPPASTPHKVTTTTSIPKRQKIPKDAAVFTEGAKVVGQINFPPYEAGSDEELAREHRKFQIHPMGEIAKYVRHIPYNSDKKDFMAKTGREAFEGRFLLTETGDTLLIKGQFSNTRTRCPGMTASMRSSGIITLASYGSRRFSSAVNIPRSVANRGVLIIMTDIARPRQRKC